MTFDRSDPDWTFDDSWMQEDEEPPTFVSCPCCGGHGHFGPAAAGQGGFYCTGRVDRLNRELRAYVKDGIVPAPVEADISCERCGDSGVVPNETAPRWTAGPQALTTAELLDRLHRRGR